MRQLTVGVVGLRAGGAHARACTQLSQTRLEALCDVDEARLAEFKDDLGVERTFTDFEDLIGCDDLELIIIATPDAEHCPMSVAALDAGKHVLVEKPMATTVEDCQRMLEAEARSGKKLNVNQVLRTNPRFVEAKRMADSGYLGEIFYCEADYVHNISRLIVGRWRGEAAHRHTPFIGGGCHMIDLLRWCVGEVEEIFAYGSHKCIAPEDYPFDDCNISVLKFASGACGKFGATYGCQRPSVRNFMLYGTEATYVSGRECDTVTVSDDPGAAIRIDMPVKGHPFGPVIGEFADAILNDAPAPIPGRDAANTIAVAVAGNQSIETGEPVRPHRFDL